ncbi:MAG: hypothetical protein L6Q35_12180, partial [Phycisphaerales bacterium]|nr:hypothetical protein [Phycisphaerales bacterium]
MLGTRSVGLLALALLAGTAAAQTITVTYSQPLLDRWNYPFASNPGAEKFAPTFGAIEIPGFDDRDGQLLVGFNTSAEVPTGLPADYYTVVSIRLTVWVGADQQFVYDPTFDSYTTVLHSNDPRFTQDTDLGKPVEV